MTQAQWSALSEEEREVVEAINNCGDTPTFGRILARLDLVGSELEPILTGLIEYGAIVLDGIYYEES